MSPREVVPAVRKIVREELPPIPYLGIVRRVAGAIADVQLAFSNRYLRDVPLLRGTDLTVGDEVLLMRANIEARWVIIGCVQSRSRGTPGGGSEGSVVVPTPSSLVVTARETYIEVAWAASLLESVILYEVMHNSSASETGATTVAVRLSQYDYHAAIGTTRHFRVRAVGTDYRRSGWTTWASATVARHDPEDVDDHSTDAAEMQESTDPGEAGSESLATTLTEELKRLRGMWAKLRPDGLEWYETINYLGLSGDFECGNYSDMGVNPRDGQWYWTLDTNKLYAGDACGWVDVAAGGGGATTFLSLTDTPASYVGEACKFPRVNAGESALEFVTHLPDHDHTGDAGDGGQISHDTALTGISADDHHAEAHAADHKDGGAQELDVSELAGALGGAGEIPETDGAAVAWVDPDGRYTPPDHAHAGLVGDGGVFPHVNLSELQGGVIGERYHLDEAEHSALTDSPDLIFNDADGLLLLDFQRWEQHGSGAARANYILGSRRERARVGVNNAVAGSRGALHFEPGRWQNKRALVVEEATFNYITNPCMYDANADGMADSWSEWDNLTGVEVKTVVDHPKDGRGWMQRFQYTGVAGDAGQVLYFWLPTAAASFAPGDDCAISADVMGTHAGIVIRLGISARNNVGADLGTTYCTITTEVSNQLTRFVCTKLNLPATTDHIRAYLVVSGVDNGDVFDLRIGAANIEKKAYATTFCWGDGGDGYSWSGVNHASTSSRTATYVHLDDYADLISDNNTMSFRVIFQPQYAANADWPDEAFIWGARGANDNNRIRLEYEDSDDKFHVYINGATRLSSNVQTFKAGDWLDVIVTLDFANDDYGLYVDATLEDVDTMVLTAPTAIADWMAGCEYDGTDQCNGILAEYAVFDRVLTVTEIAILFAEQRPLIDCAATETRPTVPGVSAGLWSLLMYADTPSTTPYAEVNAQYRITFAGAWVCGLVQFEVVASLRNAADNLDVKLQYYDTTNAAWRDVPNSELTFAAAPIDRKRTPSLAVPEQEYEYRVMAEFTDGGGSWGNLFRVSLVVSPGGDYDNL